MRKDNALDDELFEEFSAQAEKTKKFLDEAQQKLDATTLKWEKEKALKEARDLEDIKQAAIAELTRRKEARDGLMKGPQDAFDQAKEALDQNKTAIETA